MRIGVLALQGAFIEHEHMLRRLGAEAVEVRLPAHLAGLHGLILPGGESTTVGKLAVTYGLLEPLQQLAREGLPMWGTCAGMILLAHESVDGMPGQPLIGGMDITVRRNAFGRQVDSFEAAIDVPVLGPPPFRAIFIRAPLIEAVGDGVSVLACLPDEGGVAAARQGHLLATAFHPELTDDPRFHAYFLTMCQQ
ncbi:MAG: pyridoxal 5'-phosphate synthase glutaminase subunit PdxT [Chloroflexi bacterium]|nr:pyridoxal 5'-phosphate synthase glutaminase subunit PdxT [Chloroflexota bacterium]MBU1748099.1 pyridoxal 5'-phosphate synthase glutaminase subunit PdxT [Chloroflexota bacterium]